MQLLQTLSAMVHLHSVVLLIVTTREVITTSVRSFWLPICILSPYGMMLRSRRVTPSSYVLAVKSPQDFYT
ncbi:hypothetical protein EDD17DRAFT_1543947 [Pisolithus thermaeus]|nr:hypothetical protein EDD17DRAFT_1543947 [Pisolithus thermaeus]